RRRQSSLPLAMQRHECRCGTLKRAPHPYPPWPRPCSPFSPKQFRPFLWRALLLPIGRRLTTCLTIETVLKRITVHGARQHNLKNISVEIPRNTLTVVTGLSGSGKSSLAFDTIYAEGQR